MENTDRVNESAELLQALIRNACVNDGTPDSGEERRNADLLQTYLEGAGLDVQRFTARGDRTSIVARIEGSDPDAPSLCLMGHTDVVPVNPAGWSRDPFGGELIDGEIWGRGAIDMLPITASMAVVMKELARSGFRPKGDLVYFGVADEEAGGVWGAEWMVDNEWDAIACDFLLTEIAGWTHIGPDGRRKVAVNVGEKGLAWRRLTVKGTPGHGSMPYGADNALIKAAEIVRRLADYRPPSNMDEIWRSTVTNARFDPELEAMLLDPARVWDGLAKLSPQRAKHLHACGHTTISPNVVHGGIKTNVIPDTVMIDVDIRTVPGDDRDEVNAHLAAALGDLADQVEVESLFDNSSTRSPTGGAMWDSLERNIRAVYPDADLLPGLLVGATDARYFREKGTVAYGAALFAPDLGFADFSSRFHGHDERIDLTSLGYTADLWHGVVTDLVG